MESFSDMTDSLTERYEIQDWTVRIKLLLHIHGKNGIRSRNSITGK
jgi:hypothetical protein